MSRLINVGVEDKYSSVSIRWIKKKLNPPLVEF